MKLIEEQGDLFELDSKYALAHCISLDCAMGAGIAVAFDKRFNRMKQDLIKNVNINNLAYPTTIEWWCNDEYRPIYNLITKEKYWHKPTYSTITECIKQLALMCKERHLERLAMPKIGCGLDRLQWGKVKEIIEEEFKEQDIEIVIRYL